MPKLKTLKHVSSFDYSAYGYAGASIERLEVDKLVEYLKGDIASLNGITNEKSLFDLALDNVDYAIEDGATGEDLNNVFAVLNLLVESPVIEKGVSEDGSSALSKLLDKLADCNIKKAEDKSNSATIRAIKELKVAIYDLAQQYKNKEDFLSPLLGRQDIAQDMELLHGLSKGKGANRLVIENDVLDNALRSGLQAQGREKEIVSIDKRSNKEARDVEAAQYTVDGTDWSKRDRVLDSKVLSGLQQIADPALKSQAIDSLIEKLQEHKRVDQLLVLQASGLESEKMDVNIKNADGYTMLHYACLNGQVGLAKQLMARGADTSLAAGNGMTPIHMLALSERKEAAAEILHTVPDWAEKMKIEQGKPNGFMYSMLALKGGNVALAQEFLRVGTDVKTIQSQVFYRAVKSDDAALVRNFFKLEQSKEFNPSTIAVQGVNQNLLAMALDGEGEVFKAIIESGNKHLELYSNILDRAVGDGKAKAVALLLESSNSESAQNSNFNINAAWETEGQVTNLLNRAYAAKGRLEGENLSFMAECDAMSRDDKQKGMIAYKARIAQIDGIYESINKLLEHNVERHLDGDKARGLFDIQTACKAGGGKDNSLIIAYHELNQGKQDSLEAKKLEALQRIFDNILNHPGADLNIGDESGRSLLMLASQDGDKDTVGKVVLRGADNSVAWAEAINAVDVEGNTALFYAAQAGQKDVFELLVSEGATFRGQERIIANAKGMTPIMAACSGGHLHVLEVIKPTIQDVSQLDKKGNGALHYLAMGSVDEGGKEILQSLLACEAEIDARNEEGKTPLMLAVINNNVELVNELLDKGADINLADGQGNTPLIYACLLNNKSMIEAVLAAGNLDINHKNNFGVSAYLITVQRDGLENIANTDYREAMVKELNGIELGGSNQKMSEIPGLYDKNSYPGLAKELISRGADLTKSEAISLTNSAAKITLMSAAARMASVSSQVVANALPMYGGVASEVIKAGAAISAAAVVRGEVKKTIKAGVMGLANYSLTLDEKVDLKGQILIGSMNDRGWTVKYGSRLKDNIKNHPNFRNTDAIYTVRDLRAAIDADNKNEAGAYKSMEWYSRAHDSLTAQYSAVQVKIAEQPWYYTFPLVWKGVALRNVANNILKADKELGKGGNKGEAFLRISEVVDGVTKSKTFEEVFGEGKGSLLDVMKSPKLSKQLLTSIVSCSAQPAPLTEEQTNIKAIESVIDGVASGKISVAPDTHHIFCKFAKEKKDALLNDKSKQAFLKDNKILLDVIPDSKPELVKKFIGNKQKVVNDIKSSKGQSIDSEAVKTSGMFDIKGWTKWAFGAKGDHELRKKTNFVAEVVSEISADVAAVAVADQVNPGGRERLVKAASSGLDITSKAMNMGGQIISAASWLGGMAYNYRTPIVVAAAVGATGYALYQKQDAIQGVVKDVAGSIVTAARNASDYMVSVGVSADVEGSKGEYAVKDIAAASNIEVSTQDSFAALKKAAESVELAQEFDLKVAPQVAVPEVTSSVAQVKAAVKEEELEFHDAASGPAEMPSPPLVTRTVSLDSVAQVGQLEVNPLEGVVKAAGKYEVDGAGHPAVTLMSNSREVDVGVAANTLERVDSTPRIKSADSIISAKVEKDVAKEEGREEALEATREKAAE